MDIPDTQNAADKFYKIINELLNKYYPIKNITVTNKDPPFMTAELKSMLRRKNALMRKGRTEEAGALAIKISKLIAKSNSKTLTNIKSKNTKGLWSQVNRIIKKTAPNIGDLGNVKITATDLNTHYAEISTDLSYRDPILKTVQAYDNSLVVSEYMVFNKLDKLKSTSSGPDGIPFWFFRLAAHLLAGPLAHIYSLSLNSAVVPTQWKKAIITPIAKISKPVALTDYRPISVTSVLSRILERHIVSTYVYPALLDPPLDLDFTNQYAFRPSGSCTAALIAILADVSDLLKKNDCVILIALDFSRAFDSIKHEKLFENYYKLKLQNKAYNWLLSFFKNRTHSTKFMGLESTELVINSSVVQGSGLGPASYSVAASGLRPKSNKIKMHKFADDTTLITAGANYSDLSDELNHIESWAGSCNLKLNKSKSYEIIFTKKRCRLTVALPEPTLDIKRVDSIKLLGVTLHNKLSMDEHVNKILAGCSSSLYALNSLRAYMA